MKTKPSVICVCLFTTAVLGATAAWWQFQRIPPPPSTLATKLAEVSAKIHPATPSQPDDMASQLVARHRAWSRITTPADADKIEIELKDQITDANAAMIVRALPSDLLETPFGLKALEHWAKIDRMAAATWLSRQLKPTPFQIGTAVRGWISTDSKSASDYVEALPPGAWKDNVLAALGSDAVRSQEPVHALTLILQMSPGATRTRLLKDATIVWAQQDPATASEWVGKVNDLELQKTLISMTAIGYAYTDPEAAATWLLQALPQGQELDEAIGNVVAIWAGESHPEDAGAWIAGLPEGGTRDHAAGKLIERWREFNAHSASEWVASLPPGPLQRHATDSLRAKPTS